MSVSRLFIAAVNLSFYNFIFTQNFIKRCFPDLSLFGRISFFVLNLFPRVPRKTVTTEKKQV